MRRSLSQFPVRSLPEFQSEFAISPSQKQITPIYSSLQTITANLHLLIQTSPKLPADVHSFKMHQLSASLASFTSLLHSQDLATQETISKNEGKLAYIEEELAETEKKNSALNNKVRVLTNQLGQMRDEYNQLSEDFNSTIQLLKEQMASRETAMDDEEDKLYKLNSLIKVLTDEVSNKDEEIQNLREKLLKTAKSNPDDPVSSLENLEKKYKSLETLYMQQMLKNNTLQETCQDLETKLKDMELKVAESESQLKNSKVSKDNSLVDCSQGSFSETDQSTQKISWRFEATQLQNKVNEYKFELSRLEKANEDYKFEIILLHNKVAGLQAQISNRRETAHDIYEFSEQLKSNDYELTGTIEANESLKNSPFVLETINEDNYEELAKTVIINNLVSTENVSDYEILKRTIQSLVSVREVLGKHFDIKREKPDLPKDLEKFIEKKLNDLSYENKTVEHRPSKKELSDYQNHTEPSPRSTSRALGPPNFGQDIKSKLLSKKKIIVLHKEQILCLKKQLREAESTLKLQQSLDIPLLKSVVLNILDFLPKQDDKTEKEVEVCMDLLGFSQQDYLKSKENRSKKGKFRLFG